MAGQLAMPMGVTRVDNTPLQIETAFEQSMRKVFSSSGEIGRLLSSGSQMRDITEEASVQKETLNVQKESLREQKTERESKRFDKKERPSHEKTSSKRELGREQIAAITSFKNTLIGPFAALANPLKGLLGDKDPYHKKKNLSDVGVFNSGFKFSGEPTIESVKSIDPAGALIAKQLGLAEVEKKKKSSLADMLSGFKLPGLSGAVSGLLAKAGGIGLIAAGLTWGIMDGVAGMAKSDAWGTGKVAGFLGGFLGGTGSGWTGAFAGAGKWAMIGAGTGMFFGPVGAIAGGLVGAAIGGIMGFIGGENIARGLDGVFKWFKDTFDINELVQISPIGIIGRFIDNQKKIWSDDKTSLPEKLGRVIGGLGRLVLDIASWPMNLVTELFQGKILKKGVDFAQVGKFIGGLLSDFTTKVLPKFFYGIFSQIGDVGGALKSFNSGSIISSVTGAIGDLINGIFEGLGLGTIMNDPTVRAMGTTFTKGLTDTVNWISGTFGVLFEFVGKQGKNVMDLFTGKKDLFKFVGGFVENLFGMVGGMVGEFMAKNPVGQLINKYFMMPVTDFFNSIGDYINFVGTSISKGDFGALLDNKKRADFFAQAQASRNARTDEELIALYTSTHGGSDSRKFAGLNREGLLKMALSDRDFMSTADAMNNRTQVRDAIITKSGQIIHTDPLDNLYAFKSLPDLGGTAGSRAERSFANIDRNNSVGGLRDDSIIERVLQALDKRGGNNAVQQNNTYTDRFSADNLLDSLTLEVS